MCVLKYLVLPIKKKNSNKNFIYLCFLSQICGPFFSKEKKEKGVESGPHTNIYCDKNDVNMLVEEHYMEN